MLPIPAVTLSLLLYVCGVHHLVSADVAPALAPTAALGAIPPTEDAFQPTPAAPAEAPTTAYLTGASPTRSSGSNTGAPNPVAPVAPAFNPSAICAPYPSLISANADPVADYPCAVSANSREAACILYPGCTWDTARALCGGAFDPDACAGFTAAQCIESPFCTGVGTSQAAASGFANGVPPPLRPPPPPDGGGTAGPNADPVDPNDYVDGQDYTFTSDGTAAGDGVPPGGGGGGGGGAGGGGQGGSPSGNGSGRRAEFGTSGAVTSAGAVSISTPGEEDAEAPFELPEPGSLLNAAQRRCVAIRGLTLASALAACALLAAPQF